MRLSDLAKDRRTVTVTVSGGSVNVTYRPAGITPEVEDGLRAMIAEQRVGATLVAMLAGILVDWDLQDDDGAMYPIDADGLRRLPMQFLAAVAQAISGNIGPNPSSGGSSAAI